MCTSVAQVAFMSQPCNAQSDAPGHCEGRLISENLLRFPRHVEGGTAVQTELTRGWHLPHQALGAAERSEEHTSELQSRLHLVCRLLLEKKRQNASVPSSPPLPIR